MKRFIAAALTCSFFVSLIPHANAHFPWLAIGEDGRALYFFGETPADQTYKLPPSITKAEIQTVDGTSKSTRLGFEPVENDEFVGMTSTASVDRGASLVSKVTYGIYHGSRLDYYTQYQGGRLPTKCDGAALPLDLQARAVDTGSGVDVYVYWKGKPLADASVQLFCDDGHEEGKGSTDKDGKVSFSDDQVEEGLNGILVGHTEQAEGKFRDQAYDSVAHYLTMTFLDPRSYSETSDSETSDSISVTDNKFPPIPQTVTSFGAAIAGDSLYLYGGHSGRAHEYYAEAQGKTLWRLDLTRPKAWESLGDGPGLQGLAMVAHDGKLYRIGGFTAKNSDGEEEELWSQDGVAAFDPKTKQWKDLPPLPEPRSSFDAAVLGDRIYVVGGWTMRGDTDAQWLQTAYSLDLSQEPLTWESLPEPPFQRRALSVAAHDGKIYAIGGMQKVGGPTTRVDVYDPETQTWSQAPGLQGGGMDGFGSSSFAVGNQLFVTTYSGSIQRLDEGADSWRSLGQLDRARFFHRLLPLSETELIAVGGASMSDGKFEALEVIRVR